MVLPNLYRGAMNKHNMIAQEVHEMKKQFEITNLVTLRLDNDFSQQLLNRNNVSIVGAVQNGK